MAHVKKFTRANMKGLSIHLDRKTLNHSNKDIDVERSYLNYDLCQKDGDTLSRLQERLSEVHCLNREDVKVCCSWAVTLPETLKDDSENAQREFFEKTYEFLSKRYGGEKNVVSAQVHNDETTPHMHFAFIPVVDDKKKQREKVSAKEVLNRKELQSFHQDLDNFLKQEIPHVYQEGILNGKTKDKNIENIHEYKEIQQKIEEKKNELLSLSERIPDTNIKLKAKKEIQTEVKPKLIGKPEIIKTETENYVFTPKQVEKIENMIAAAVTVKKDYERLQGTDLVQENKDLREALDTNHEALLFAQKRNGVLERENKTLKNENRDLKAYISDLKHEIKLVYQSAKEFLKERTNGLKAFRSVFRDLVDKVKEKSPESEFEKNYKRDRHREMDKGLER